MSTSKKFVLGATTGIIGLGIKTVLNIIVYPFILQKLGVEHYGLYVLLLNLADLIILMDLGLTSGIIQRLSTFRSMGREDEARQLLSVGFILYAVLALLSFLVCYSVIPWIPGFFSFQGDMAAIASFCLSIILLEGTITLFQGYFSAVLISHTLYQWVNTSESLYFIIANGGIFLLLHAGFGLREIALLRLAAAILKFAIVFFHAGRVDPACLRPFFFNFGKALDLLKVSIHAMVRTVSDIFANRMDLVMIGRFLGIRDVAIFEFVYRFLNIIMQVPMHIVTGILPIFTRLKTGNETDASRQLFLRLSAFIFFAVTVPIGLLYFFYHGVISFFAAGRLTFQETNPLFLLAIPGIISSAVCLPASHYLFAAGRFRLITTSSSLMSLMKVLMVVLLIRPLGLFGVILSTLFVDVIYHQMLLIREACREMSIGFLHYLLQVYLKGLPALILTFLLMQAAKYLFSFSTVHIMIQLLVSAAVSAPIGLVAWFALTASVEERNLVRGWLTDLTKKVGKPALSGAMNEG
jgi:O-antigen/teichoic acid export membrane protein